MGSSNILFEVTVPIIMYVALVDISCQQRLQCVCKHFKDAESCCENTSFPKLYFSLDILASSLIPDYFVIVCIGFKNVK